MNRTRMTMKEWGAHRRATYEGPLAATDLIIEYLHPTQGDGIILIDRGYEPLGLALPGGFAERMALPKNAVKEAKEETSLDVFLYEPHRPLCVFSDLERDPREHVMTLVYTARGTGVLKAGDDAKRVYHYPLETLAQIPVERFAFPDHKEAIDLYLAWHKRRTGGD